MRVSLNELQTTARKAGLGTGIPVGAADEIGHAVLWLAGNGEDAVGAALAGLHDGLQVAPAPALKRHGAGWRLASVAVAIGGPGVVDWVFSTQPGEPVALSEVDAPTLLIGLIGQALARSDAGRAVTVFGAGMSVTVAADGLSASLGVLTPGIGLTLRLERAGRGGLVAPPDGVEVDRDAWRELAVLAARTLVPADAASRARGAGAGDIDNE